MHLLICKRRPICVACTIDYWPIYSLILFMRIDIHVDICIYVSLKSTWNHTENDDGYTVHWATSPSPPSRCSKHPGRRHKRTQIELRYQAEEFYQWKSHEISSTSVQIIVSLSHCPLAIQCIENVQVWTQCRWFSSQQCGVFCSKNSFYGLIPAFLPNTPQF